MIVTYNGSEACAFEARLNELASFYLRQQQNLRGSDSIWLVPGNVEQPVAKWQAYQRWFE